MLSTDIYNAITEQNLFEGWRLLKLSQMGTQVVHMKGVLLWLVRWAHCAYKREFCPALATLFGPVKYIVFLTAYTTVCHFICPHCPTSWPKQSCQVACLLIRVSGGA
jgi:hypothetical protein